MAEHDTERGIDVKRLRLGKIVGRTRRRVAHVTDAQITFQGAHVAGAKDVAHQTRPLVQVESVALRRGNACRVLATVLQHHQTIIEQLVNRRCRHHTKNPAHSSIPLN